MSISLLEQLAEKGLRWIPGGMESHDWLDDELTCNWIIDKSLHYSSLLNSGGLEKLQNLDYRASILLSQACVSLLMSSDGVLSKDMAIIGHLNSIESGLKEGSFDPEVDFLCRGLINRGRSIDCSNYFHNSFDEGIFDETYSPDMEELLSECHIALEMLVNNGDNIGWINDDSYSRSFGNLLFLVLNIQRGILLNIEMSLFSGIGTPNQINESLQRLMPGIAKLNQTLMTSISRESNQAIYIKFCGLLCYMTYFLKRIGLGSEVQLSSLLDTVNKGCSDEEEKDSFEAYNTLFSHIIRLRLIRETPSIAHTFDNAIKNALEALKMANKIHGVETYQRIIEDIRDGVAYDSILMAKTFSNRN